MFIKIIRILNSKLKFELKLIFILLIIVTLLETLNIGMLIPVLTSIFSDSYTDTLENFRTFFGLEKISKSDLFQQFSKLS